MHYEFKKRYNDLFHKEIFSTIFYELREGFSFPERGKGGLPTFNILPHRKLEGVQKGHLSWGVFGKSDKIEINALFDCHFPKTLHE